MPPLQLLSFITDQITASLNNESRGAAMASPKDLLSELQRVVINFAAAPPHGSHGRQQNKTQNMRLLRTSGPMEKHHNEKREHPASQTPDGKLRLMRMSSLHSSDSTSGLNKFNALRT